jgi:hypothetical protein
VPARAAAQDVQDDAQTADDFYYILGVVGWPGALKTAL